ncbi:MAG: hypothetical protein V3T77_06340, partial [Planctomycetota bacterium]
MRRVGFFLAVFCIGLMAFLVFTGQFGKMFYGSGAPFEPFEVWPDPNGDEDDRNFFKYYSHDLKRGRVRFIISGVIEGDRGLEINMAELEKTGAMRNAVLELPLYDEA